MKTIAITGATGLLGKQLTTLLLSRASKVKAWYRNQEKIYNKENIEWIRGELGYNEDCEQLVQNTDAIIHAAIYKEKKGFTDPVQDVISYAQKNILGTLELIEAAKKHNLSKFVFVSSCGVYNKILDNTELNEKHPTIPYSHYGAVKSSIDNFVYSYSKTTELSITSIRPCAIYSSIGEIKNHRWYQVLAKVKAGKDIKIKKGSKFVHVDDVAKSILLLIQSENTNGVIYNCYDQYIDDYKVATLAKKIANSDSKIIGDLTEPKNQIICNKLKELGMQFGGNCLLETTIKSLISRV